MPIECSFDPPSLTKDEYHSVDHQVTGLAFKIHNELGRLYDERIYREELRFRCRRAGLEARQEAPIRVTHGDFRKNYYVDLIVEGVLFELKAADSVLVQREMDKSI
jgi:GxxExxY protein